MANDTKRRLATILAADVVGYSGQMAHDEDGTVARLRASREIIDKLIDRHDGRIFSTGGDSVLAEFGSTVEAVRCAITIQEEIRVRNSNVPPAGQMQFRIGVNVGDVIVDRDDLLGDGVNVAARLESIAEPGGICISGSTFEQVKNKLSVGFQDMGLQQVKNIPDPVSAFAIASAPVSVRHALTDVGESAARRKRFWLAGALLALVAAAGGVWWWQSNPSLPGPFATLPANIPTSEMSAAQVRDFMSGMIIRGSRRSDKRFFSVSLEPDMTAKFEFVRVGDSTAVEAPVLGSWSAEDSRFCMQVRTLNLGRPICPTVAKKDATIRAYRPDGSLIPWTLSK